MRYGVLADVHGNLHALQVALAALQTQGVDAYLCAGDLVGYGPFPNECVDLVAALGPVCVAGNHDLAAAGRLPSGRLGGLAATTLRWTRDELDGPSRAYLERLPLTAEAEGGLVVAHGSLTDPEAYVRRTAQAADQLELLAERRPGARVLVLGHTHHALGWAPGRRAVRAPKGGRFALPASGPCLVNPGSVGQSREREAEPRVRCMVLDLTEGRAEFLALPYDHEACRAALRGRGLPALALHVPAPSLTGRALRRARELASP